MLKCDGRLISGLDQGILSVLQHHFSGNEPPVQHVFLHVLLTLSVYGRYMYVFVCFEKQTIFNVVNFDMDGLLCPARYGRWYIMFPDCSFIHLVRLSHFTGTTLRAAPSKIYACFQTNIMYALHCPYDVNVLLFFTLTSI